MLTVKDDLSVPVCLSGMIEKIQIDICMDGASYRIISALGDYRIKPRNRETEDELERVAGSRTPIGICGDWRWSAHCSYLDAYWAGSPDRLNSVG